MTDTRGWLAANAASRRRVCGVDLVCSRASDFRLQRLEESSLFQESAFELLLIATLKLVDWCIDAGGICWLLASCGAATSGDFLEGKPPINSTGNLRLGNANFQAS